TVIEILVKAGDRVTKEEGLVTLEGEKATMEIPAPMDGEIKKVHINLDQEVTQGMLIIEMQGESDSQVNEETPATAPPPPVTDTSVPNEPVVSVSSQHVYSSPSVRRYAREFGIDLGLIKGTGEKGRVQKSDLIAFVKSRVNGGGSAIPSVPDEDFSKYGEIQSAPLSRIKQFTAKNMQRNWLNVPHVTQFHEVEVTELTNAFSSLKKECKAKGQKITLLPYLMKALVNSLKEFPEFNSSLHPDGKTLILKSYFHIGIAADTPQGLVVPVIRDVDQKEFMGLNQELKEVSEQAREKGLPPQAMKGGSMTISNLGGIGGGHFTPIINVPEVAILGVSRQFKKPSLIDGQWQEQDVLPISLSYDHRVIDGAQGARFLMHLSNEITTRVNELLIGE
ncbi:MAG: branched-chain alpha-keto acid dehydrogenase subunit E2, partial [Legionellales bacterium]|nr:branched-chain alpha-keto acid dehydrogenase subunit E2 [Legionellales bacterium]